MMYFWFLLAWFCNQADLYKSIIKSSDASNVCGCFPADWRQQSCLQENYKLIVFRCSQCPLRIIGLQLVLADLNSPLFGTQNPFPWICSSFFTIRYLELPLFRTIFRFPSEFEITGFYCICNVKSDPNGYCKILSEREASIFWVNSKLN